MGTYDLQVMSLTKPQRSTGTNRRVTKSLAYQNIPTFSERFGRQSLVSFI